MCQHLIAPLGKNATSLSRKSNLFPAYSLINDFYFLKIAAEIIKYILIRNQSI